MISRWQRRRILPKDLWPVKALICWGTDTAIHRDELRRYWGVDPYEFTATTEAGIMAMQAWDRRGMTFVPAANFLEFIREDELARERRSPGFEPATHTMDELDVGRRYEVVITSCTGMPFVRYRTGELMEVVAERDDQVGTGLPQFLPAGRADEIIDIEGFTRLDENTVGRAINAVEPGAVEWTARKEYEVGVPVLRVYVEHAGEYPDFESRLHQSLVEHDSYYRDLQAMLEVRPMRVNEVAACAFRSFSDARRERGYALDRRNMPRMNATDDEIAELLACARVRAPMLVEAA